MTSSSHAEALGHLDVGHLIRLMQFWIKKRFSIVFLILCLRSLFCTETLTSNLWVAFTSYDKCKWLDWHRHNESISQLAENELNDFDKWLTDCFSKYRIQICKHSIGPFSQMLRFAAFLSFVWAMELLELKPHSKYLS